MSSTTKRKNQRKIPLNEGIRHINPDHYPVNPDLNPDKYPVEDSYSRKDKNKLNNDN